jgi:hypothetical protein
MRISRRTRNAGGLVAATLLAIAQPISGHTWLEQARKIAPNGTMVGDPGFQRHYIARTASNFTGDINQLRSNATIGPTDKICKDPVGSYFDPNFPMLQVSPGDFIALQYLENGHVTKFFVQPGKPANRGTVYVYGTDQPSDDDTILGVHLQWTVDGTGGDQRGRLLATRNFDDGQCYEANDSPLSQQRQGQFKKPAEAPMDASLWCQTDLQLPNDIATNGTYTLYWVWDWPLLDPTKIDINSTANGDFPSGNLAGQDPRVVKAETYTSCLELQVVPAVSGSSLSNLAVQFDDAQDLTFAAVASQLQNNFDVPVFGDITNGTNSTLPATQPGNGPAATEAVTTVVVTAPPVTVTQVVTVYSDEQTNSPVTQSTQKITPTPAIATGAPEVSPFLKVRSWVPRSDRQLARRRS